MPQGTVALVGVNGRFRLDSQFLGVDGRRQGVKAEGTWAEVEACGSTSSRVSSATRSAGVSGASRSPPLPSRNRSPPPDRCRAEVGRTRGAGRAVRGLPQDRTALRIRGQPGSLERT